MGKFKPIEARKQKGFSQNYMADKFCMDVSNYNRHEKGTVKITTKEWETLAEILETPMENIYEAEESQIFICRDNATGNYQGTNNIYTVPEYLLENQRKYIQKLEVENALLKEALKNKTHS